MSNSDRGETGETHGPRKNGDMKTGSDLSSQMYQRRSIRRKVHVDLRGEIFFRKGLVTVYIFRCVGDLRFCKSWRKIPI